MSNFYAGKVVWITGASAGIGKTLALEAAKQGADVAVSARRADKLADVVREVQALGRKAVAVPCDVCDEASVAAAVKSVVKELGKLDVAIANAGFGVTGSIESLSAADWRRQMETNVIGAVVTAREALPELRKTKGAVALVGSVSAFAPMPTQGAYCASKAALRAIGQTLAMELHGTGVSCTTLHPGFVESDIGRVDNNGHFEASRKDPRPAALIWPTEKAAKVMLKAIAGRKREFVFTAHGKVGAFLALHFPGLLHFVMARAAKQLLAEAVKIDAERAATAPKKQAA